MRTIRNVNDWVKGYGGRLNHRIAGYKGDRILGTVRTLFYCGKFSDFIEYGYDSTKGKCKNCLKKSKP